MKKSKRKRANATLRSSSLRSTRRAVSAGKSKSRSKAAEYVSNLLELHKLQGIILNRLDKEV